MMSEKYKHIPPGAKTSVGVAVIAVKYTVCVQIKNVQPYHPKKRLK